MNETTKTIILVIIALLLVISLIFGVVWAWKSLKVFTREMDGKAELAEAQWSRQIAVEEAQARKESAVLDAQAEIERAKGVREANEIIAGSLKGNEEYLRYLWIDRVAGSDNVIYVPTEASLPILEAGMRPTK